MAYRKATKSYNARLAACFFFFVMLFSELFFVLFSLESRFIARIEWLTEKLPRVTTLASCKRKATKSYNARLAAGDKAALKTEQNKKKLRKKHHEKEKASGKTSVVTFGSFSVSHSIFIPQRKSSRPFFLVQCIRYISHPCG